MVQEKFNKKSKVIIKKATEDSNKDIFIKAANSIGAETVELKIESECEDMLKEAHAPNSHGLKDSGSREEFSTGAMRDDGTEKGRYDLLVTQALFRDTLHLERGASKYNDRNYEKGMPISRCFDAAMRHLNKYLAGWNDEDHLAAARWNLAAIMLYEHRMPELMDLPERSKKVEDIQRYCKFKED